MVAYRFVRSGACSIRLRGPFRALPVGCLPERQFDEIASDACQSRHLFFASECDERFSSCRVRVDGGRRFGEHRGTKRSDDTKTESNYELFSVS